MDYWCIIGTKSTLDGNRNKSCLVALCVVSLRSETSSSSQLKA
jgi:hypothetical protein